MSNFIPNNFSTFYMQGGVQASGSLAHFSATNSHNEYNYNIDSGSQYHKGITIQQQYNNANNGSQQNLICQPNQSTHQTNIVNPTSDLYQEVILEDE